MIRWIVSVLELIRYDVGNFIRSSVLWVMDSNPLPTARAFSSSRALTNLRLENDSGSNSPCVARLMALVFLLSSMALISVANEARKILVSNCVLSS